MNTTASNSMFTTLCCKPHNYRYHLTRASRCICDVSAIIGIETTRMNFVFLGLVPDPRIYATALEGGLEGGRGRHM